MVQVLAGLSPLRTGFGPVLVRVVSVRGEAALLQVTLRVLRFALLLSCHYTIFIADPSGCAV